MNYLFITNQFMIGGVERVFLNIASNINNTKILLLPIHSVYDENLIKQLPQNVTLLKNKNIKIDGVKSFYNLFRLAHYVNSEIIKEPEELCCINFSDTISTILVSNLINAKKHMSWCHCNPHAYKKSKFFAFYKLLFKKFDSIVCICNSQKTEFCKVFGNHYETKIQLCFNLTDIKRIDALKTEPHIFEKDYILMVARFDNRSKDFFTLINAYKQLNEELKQRHKLVLVGDGPDLDKIKEFAKVSGENENIIFTGNQANPYKWMASAKVFVLSSKTEGFSLVICEALSCECPVISSDCVSGPKDILQDEKYGLLFNVGNETKLTEKLNILLTDSVIYNKFRNSARERVLQINKDSKNSLNKIFNTEEK